MTLYVRSAIWLVLPLLADVVAPVAIADAQSARVDLASWQAGGLVLVFLGGLLLVDCVFLRFAREGRGTLVIFDAPRFVVRGGSYQHVRNPMYVANITIVLGLSVLYASWAVLAWAITLFVVFHLFVVLYEEPTLLRTFGDDYATYRRRVRRWLPRLSRG